MIRYEEWAEELLNDVNGFRVIRIKQGPFKDVDYVYGGVAIEEGEDIATIRFDYTIINGVIEDNSAFKQLAGDILVAMIDKQLLDNNVIYSGGT